MTGCYTYNNLSEAEVVDLLKSSEHTEEGGVLCFQKNCDTADIAESDIYAALEKGWCVLL